METKASIYTDEGIIMYADKKLEELLQARFPTKAMSVAVEVDTHSFDRFLRVRCNGLQTRFIYSLTMFDSITDEPTKLSLLELWAKNVDGLDELIHSNGTVL